MDRMDFTHAVARIRVMEKRLLNKNTIEKLLEAEGYKEALKILGDTPYGSSIGDLETVHDYEKILKEELIDLYKTMYQITPLSKVIDIMTLRYDYHNVKVILKSKALGKDLSHLLISAGALSTDALKGYLFSNELKEMDEHFRQIILRVEEDFEESKNPQVIDIELDKCLYSDMLQLASELGIDFITAYVKQSIDIINIKTMLRVQKQGKDIRFLEETLIPGGTISLSLLITGLNTSLEEFSKAIQGTPYSKALCVVLDQYGQKQNIALLDVLYDNYIMSHIREAKKVNFGPEPLIAYVIAKETDIKILRIILVGKINRVSPEVIRERLRELYA